jgi:hypothetical protein
MVVAFAPTPAWSPWALAGSAMPKARLPSTAAAII